MSRDVKYKSGETLVLAEVYSKICHKLSHAKDLRSKEEEDNNSKGNFKVGQK